jgi:LysR family transcriptional regulator for bpeEF and oprC
MFEKFKSFITVIEQGSFSKAALKIGTSKATITRNINDLEDSYGAKLLTRSTRFLSLTEQGEIFYNYALELLQLDAATHEKLTNSANQIQGNLKIGLPFSLLYQFTTHELEPLLRAYPDLSFELMQGNHINDLLSSHFDLVIHCGPLPNVNFYYEQIGTWTKMLCASPKYIKQNGMLKSVDSLKKHRCIDHAENHTMTWQLKTSDELKNIPVTTNIRISCGILIKELAKQGAGIAYLPSFIINEDIKAGYLKPLLKKSWPDELPIYALYPLKKRYNQKIILLIDTLKKLFS